MPKGHKAGAQVGAHEVLVSEDVAPLDRVQDRFVFAEGLSLDGATGLAALHDPQDHRRHNAVDVEDRPVADQRYQPGVKPQVVLRRVDQNEYKRKQAAPGLRVTTKAFGVGRRLPIVMHWDRKQLYRIQDDAESVLVT